MRLLTFGCSFTDYAWPTWADIMAADLGCDYENWAIGGGGNQQIARRLMYRLAEQSLQPDDWIMVQWTSLSREDRYIGSWRAQGSVAHSAYYGSKWLRDHWSWNNDVINTAQAQSHVRLLAGKNLQYEMTMPWGDSLVDQTETPLDWFWRSRTAQGLDELPINSEPLQGMIPDAHPDPEFWLMWVEHRIYPKLGLTLNPHTRFRVSQFQAQLLELAARGLGMPEIQQRSRELTVELGWKMNKYKPGSDTGRLSGYWLM